MADAYGEAIEKRQGEIKKKFLEALRELPIIEVACKKSGVSRTTCYRWWEKDNAFAQECEHALQQGREFINDMSESVMLQLIKEKKMPAIALWLKHNSSRYGARATSRTLPVQMPELSAKETKLFRKALALSGGGIPKHGKNIKQKKIG